MRRTPFARLGGPALSLTCLLFMAVGCTSDASGSATSTSHILTDTEGKDASAAALASKELLALTGDHRVAVESINSSGATGYVQVYVRLLDGPATLSGEWPHAVIDNPAPCETCEADGPLRWHFETDTAAYSVDALLVNVEPGTGVVREVLPVPSPTAPPAAPTTTH